MKEDLIVRMRLKFSRTGEAAGLSHLEQIRELRRIAEESGLPCVRGKCGKTKIAKMSFGPAVSVGYESMCEYADLYLSARVGEEEVCKRTSAAAGRGIAVLGARRIPRHFPSIEALVNVAEYEITGEVPPGYGTSALKDFLEKKEILIAKKKPNGVNEVIDARPLIISMEMKRPDMLRLLLRFGPKRNVKPERIAFLSMGIKEEEQASCQGIRTGFSVNSRWKVKRVGLYWENSAGQLAVP